MARLSKVPGFRIYEDTGNPAQPTGSTQKPITTPPLREEEPETSLVGAESPKSSHEPGQELDACEELANTGDEQYDRRESAITATSISSFPDSVYDNDEDETVAQSVPPIICTPFRRPESVRRMQMSSPPPFQSKPATPRSVRTSKPRGKLRTRRYQEEESDEWETEDESKEYPLVLLHITLLPVSLPWSMNTMQAVLPAHVLENLHLLRSKLSDTIVQRGILVPHPRDEYELLEERLLQALELTSERITKCGHFRSRLSTDSSITSSSLSSSRGRDSDSGLGSSGSEADVCMTCQHHIKRLASVTGEGKMKWSIRVFAANGLMRPPTWAAAWGEMESVDVEILPWIKDEEKRELDRKREEEEAEESSLREDEQKRIRQLVEEEVREAYEKKKRLEELPRQPTTLAPMPITHQPETPNPLTLKDCEDPRPRTTSPVELPQVYRPSQIPISILLRNYIYLLLQDRRKVATFFFALVAAFLALRMTAPRIRTDWTSTSISCAPLADGVARIQAPSDSGSRMQNFTHQSSLPALTIDDNSRENDAPRLDEALPPPDYDPVDVPERLTNTASSKADENRNEDDLCSLEPLRASDQLVCGTDFVERLGTM